MADSQPPPRHLNSWHLISGDRAAENASECCETMCSTLQWNYLIPSETDQLLVIPVPADGEVEIVLRLHPALKHCRLSLRHKHLQQNSSFVEKFINLFWEIQKVLLRNPSATNLLFLGFLTPTFPRPSSFRVLALHGIQWVQHMFRC